MGNLIKFNTMPEATEQFDTPVVAICEGKEGVGYGSTATSKVTFELLDDKLKATGIIQEV